MGDLLPEARRSAGPSARLSTLEQARARWTAFVRQHPGLVLWGAGAKGATFANLTDVRGEHIVAVVDINPRKCGRFVAGTGHPIVAPTDMPAGTRDILIMNGNYRAEIERQMAGRDLRFHVLGED